LRGKKREQIKCVFLIKYHKGGIQMRKSLTVLFIFIISLILAPTAAFCQNSGWFLSYSRYDIGSWPESVAIGDVNNDGLKDVVCATSYYFDPENDYKLFVFIQDASGELNEPVKYDGDNGYSVDIGDLNNDGLKDVVVSTDSGIGVYYQNGFGGLNAMVELASQPIVRKVRAADLNDDNEADVVAIGWSSDEVDVFIQSGGVLSLDNTYTLTYHGYPDLDAGDLNDDGLNDILVTSGQGVITEGISILFQDPGTPGTFINPTYYEASFYPNGCAIGDLNYDTWKDVIVASSSTAEVFYQNTGGTLDTPPDSYTTAGSNHPVLVGDVNRDNRLDALIAASTTLSVLFQQGDGSLGGLETYDLPYATWLNPHGMAMGDFNNDGMDDLVFANYNYGVVILWGWDGTPAIVIRNPGGGDSYNVGASVNIQWDTIGDITEVDISYSINGGLNWTVIDSNVTNNGSYLWNLPYTPSDNCLVRVVNSAGGTIGQSIWPFSIVDDGVDRVIVTTPNGGESLMPDTLYNITWLTTGTVANVKIEYSTDNGSNWTGIIASTSAVDGSYSWTVPNEVSNQCLVRISDAADSNTSDTSDDTFSIGVSPSSITLTSPNGGEKFWSGSTQMIKWNSTGSINKVRIQYSINNGSSWTYITKSTINDGMYNWTVPNTPSSQCLVKISDAPDGDPFDTSDAVFSILAAQASITITSPQGGESWEVGSNHKITWTSSDQVGDVKIEYSFDNQATWHTIISSTPNDGKYTWKIPNTPSDTCFVRIREAADGIPSSTNPGTFSIIPPIGEPEISLNRTGLYYGWIRFSDAKTGTQTITVNNTGTGTLNWQASVYDKDQNDHDDLSWLKINNTSGIQTGKVEVYIEPTGLAVGTYIGAVKFSDPNAINSPQLVNITLIVYAAQTYAAPFGTFETPVDGSVVMSSIPVTGWVLDEIGIDKVTIWRDAVPGEGGGEIYIGDAVLVEGVRPDVEQAYPTYPLSYKAGWGYMLLTNMLPHSGNGTFTLHAYVTDLSGHEIKLGSKTIVCDNANAIKPFGAIDSPDQGGEAAGSNFRSQGWALTPMPNKIPVDGSTIKVYIDGQQVGNCTYNKYREDIAALFPGYANTNGAHAYFEFDTTAYENGVHTIQWVVTDNAGNTDGIGSRYFTIHNPGNNSRAVGQTNQMNSTGKSFDRKIPVDFSSPVKISTGYGKEIDSRTVTADKDGMIYISIPQDERIVLDLSQPRAQSYTGYLKVNDHLRPLPPGSSLDSSGTFYWQPGYVSFGKYHMIFISKDKTGKTGKKIIIIEITPKISPWHGGPI
jgi:hypothetical protein